MPGISRSALFGKLNPTAYKAIESATVFCKLRGNPYVELVHWLHQILQLQDSDIHRIIRHFKLDPSRLAADVTAALDRLPRGATSITDLSQHLDDATERAWVYASLGMGATSIRTGHLVLGVVVTRELRNALVGISREFEKVSADALQSGFAEIVAGSPEEGLPSADGASAAAPGEASGAMAPAQMGRQEALKQFCKDLTEEARAGKIDPIVGRDEETRQCIDILMRRRQNNPLLVGEAGVGKTAVAEGFAHKIVAGDVPPPLRDVRLLELDVSALQAGASMKGEFEQRLKQVIEEVQASPKPIILFIDEVHRLIGAGGASGTGDAAQLLKPALARGALRTIAATTWAEYKKHIEKDPALTRRFQTVAVDEPSEERAILMLRKAAAPFEKHHRVQILDEAIESAVKLSRRYIHGRQLPDKAVSLLDTACARVAVGQHAQPPEVEDARSRIRALETERDIVARESAVGFEHAGRIEEIEERLMAERDRLARLEREWIAEKALVDRILEVRAKLRGPVSAEKVEGTGSAAEAMADAQAPHPAPAEPAEGAAGEADRQDLLAELRRLQAELADIQGERPLILPCVDAQAVAAVVADWTGIPVGRMVKDEARAVLQLAETLGKRIIGQNHALEMIARRIQTSRAGLENPSKPIGVFLLAGTSGVGKTETALALAETLYGDEASVITINMSEYQEAHKVATLMGSPPGYVGYGEGGVLTEAVRRRPYSIVLLDEVEKAHPDVHEIFFQVFDKGQMKDSEGRDINFRNTIILLTTNAGSDLLMKLCSDPELLPTPEALAEALRKPLLEVFPAALLGRTVTIPYYPLSDEMIRAIIRLQLGRIEKRVRENHGVPFTYTDDVVETIAARCTELESGGRMVDAILTNTVLPRMSGEFLARTIEGGKIERVHIAVEGSDFVYSFDAAPEPAVA